MSMNLMNSVKSINDADGRIELEAPGKTDIFNDPLGSKSDFGAPVYYIVRKGDFVVRCMARPDFHDAFDAGGLIVFESPKKWAKFGLENTDNGYPALVSSVTDKVSDEANGEKVQEVAVWLQVARRGKFWAMHFSADGKEWRTARCFRLSMKSEVSIGLYSQSPSGGGCKTVFTGYELIDNAYKDLRKAK